MPYRRFLPWNVAGGVLWGTGSALLGYFGGQKLETIVRWTGRAEILLFVAVDPDRGVAVECGSARSGGVQQYDRRSEPLGHTRGAVAKEV
jgi:hypothetical protein